MKSALPVLTLATTSRVKFKRILFATDLGPASEQAQIYAAGLARLFGAQLFVLYVRPDTDNPFCRRVVRGKFKHNGYTTGLKIDQLREFLQISGLPHTLLLEKGDIHEVLNHVVAEYSIDVVIVGTHGRQGIAYLAHGSTSEEVSRSSSHPVIAVGPHAHYGVGKALNRIVYATDFSEESKLALPYAISLAQEFQAELVMLHVPPKTENLRNREQMETYFMTKLHNLAPQNKFPWCSLSYVVSFGNALENILAEAQNREADMIVIGLHSSVQFTSHVPERLSYRILCEAPCPVLTVLPSVQNPKFAEAGAVFLPMAPTVN